MMYIDAMKQLYEIEAENVRSRKKQKRQWRDKKINGLLYGDFPTVMWNYIIRKPLL